MATKDELKKSLDEKGTKYSGDETKAELETLLGDEDSEKKDETVEDEGVIDAASSKTGENTGGVMSPHSGADRVSAAPGQGWAGNHTV